MRTLLLFLILIASVGPALVYRLAQPAPPIIRAGTTGRRWTASLILTALVAILLIGLGIPARPGVAPVIAALVLCGIAMTLSVVAWRAIPEAERKSRGDISAVILAPALAAIFGIMLAAFLALPTGWTWL